MCVSAGQSDPAQHQQMSGEAEHKDLMQGMDHSQHQMGGDEDPHATHKAMMQEMDHSQHEGMSGVDDPHAAHKAMMKQPAEPAKSADVDLLDKTLVNQDGEEVKLVTDVIGDRLIVMDFVYTSCTTVCPVLSALFNQVQEKLGDRLGKEVFLVSVSVDPTRDTPQRLKTYAAKHDAKEGWIWLTGPKRTMDEVLDGLGAYTPNFENHPSMVLVGDGRTGEWSRFFGFPNPDRILEQVNTLQAARQSADG
jgi:protein SCO1/2